MVFSLMVLTTDTDLHHTLEAIALLAVSEMPFQSVHSKSTAPSAAHAAVHSAHSAEITGVILAGGQGSRMDGQDKGLVPLDGQPLALRVLQRLRPQVGCLAISANRNLDRYSQWATTVWMDANIATAEDESYKGPLAGVQSALRNSTTALVQLAACDTPFLPMDLVATLTSCLNDSIDIVVPETLDADGKRWQHPTFALMRRTVLPSLDAFLARGERKFMFWVKSNRHTFALLPDHDALRNFNTIRDIEDFEKR